MKLTGNTILITGGSSGIGFELSKRLIEHGNQIIICGRSIEKLQRAKEQLPAIHTYQCDLSEEKQCAELAQWIMEEHPTMNVLVNNAAIVHKAKFTETETILDHAALEVDTNFMAPIRLIHHLYPQLKKNAPATIINITTGLVFVPRAAYPFYNATKAALHSFTRVLRKQTEDDKVAIREVMFPPVSTEMHQGNPPNIAIEPEKAVSDMLKGLETSRPEIRIGGANLLYWASRIAPGYAFNKVSNLKY